MEAAEILMATHYAASSESRRLRNGIFEMVSAVKGMTRAINELKEETVANREATWMALASLTETMSRTVALHRRHSP